jgi:hypothetical protein
MKELEKLPWKTIGLGLVGGYVALQAVSYIIPVAIIGGVGYIGYKAITKK